MPDHPLTAVGAAADLYVQETEPTETPQPAPDGDGGVWYPTTPRATEYAKIFDNSSPYEGVTSQIAIGSNNYYFGDGRQRVFSVDKNDGTEQWMNDLGDNISGIAVDSNNVYVGAGSTLYALNKDGTINWEVTSLSDTVTTKVKIDSDNIYFGAGSTIYSLSKSDGLENWNNSFSVNNIENWISVDSNNVYFGSRDNNVYSVAKSDGSQNWSFTVGSRPEGGSAIDDNSLYFGSGGGEAYSVAKSDGSENWSFSIGSNSITSGFAVDSEQVYFGGQSDMSYALNKSDGTEVWSNSYTRPPASDFVETDLAVYYMVGDSSNPLFYAIDKQDGSEIYTFAFNNDIQGDAISVEDADSGEFVYFSDYNMNLSYTYKLKTEAVIEYETARISNGTKWVTQQ